MDSGNNSGSMQSSDEEYESRGESFTSFLNPSGGGGHFGSISDHHHHQPPPSPPLLPQQYHQNSLFNPSSQNLEAAFAQSSNVNTQYGGNHDVIWSRGLRSQNNHHPNFENFVALSSSSSPSSFSSSSNQSLFGASHSQLLLNQQQPQFASSSSSTMPSQSAEGNPPRTGSNQHSDHHQSIGKNPKKRTRASRRAPTTVLTTDTTNFRQMVQEFTGIPAAPFSSSPYSSRLDLFSGGVGGVSGMRSGNLDALNPLYPLRPSVQKLQISPFLPQSSSSSSPSSLLSSTMLEALVSATNQSTTNNASSTTPENLLSMHNQMLSFQQQQPTSLKNSTSILGTKSLTAATANANVTSSNNLRSTTQQGVPVTSFDDFGLNHENVNENVGNINQQLGSNISGNYQFNCSASTSEFHSEKGLENVSSSGEGTVGQWVCPDH